MKDLHNLTEYERARIQYALDKALPRVLPARWQVMQRFSNACFFELRRKRGDGYTLRVIVGVELHDRLWLHVSCSARGRLPTWEELRQVKDLFCGRDALALQVLAPHPYVLHLWVALEGERPTPDFRHSGDDGELMI